MNKTYTEALEAFLDSKMDRMNLYSSLADLQDAGASETKQKQLVKAVAEADEVHKWKTQNLIKAAVAEIGEILNSLSEALCEK